MPVSNVRVITCQILRSIPAELSAVLFSLQIIFRVALAVFKYKEEEFLKLQDSMAIFKYLRYFTRTILDSR